MTTLSRQIDFRPLQSLKFCYVCAQSFVPVDEIDRDHVPAKGLFSKSDRAPALILPTHRNCNGKNSPLDQKMGQLIGLLRGEIPSRRNRQLKFKILRTNLGALENLEIDQLVWRWVRGFHAALYSQPLLSAPIFGAVQTPFPRSVATNAQPIIEPLLPQHVIFVQKIKEQRAKRNLDSIYANNGRLAYECVWCQGDNDGPWFCVFALNLHDWKDLGKTTGQPSRGCAGMYQLISATAPPTAAREIFTPIIIPNLDYLDPFGP